MRCIAPPPTRPRTRLLLLADTHVPGWRVFVDSRPARLLRANGVFRAVVVPPGARRVVFVYRPAAFRLGLYVSLLTAALLLAGGIAHARKEHL